MNNEVNNNLENNGGPAINIDLDNNTNNINNNVKNNVNYSFFLNF